MYKGEIPLRLTLGKQNIEAQAIAERFSCQYKKSSDIVWAVRGPTTGTSHSYTLKFTQEQSAVSPEALVHKIPVTPPSHAASSYPHSNLHILTSTTVQIPVHCHKMWHRTYPLCNAPLSKSERHSELLCYRNHTKITIVFLMHGLVFGPAQELPGIVGTRDYKRGLFNY